MCIRDSRRALQYYSVQCSDYLFLLIGSIAITNRSQPVIRCGAPVIYKEENTYVCSDIQLCTGNCGAGNRRYASYRSWICVYERWAYSGQSLSLIHIYKTLPVKAMADTHNRYFLRLQVEDRCGVLAEILEHFAKYQASVAQIMQKESKRPDTAEVVVITKLVSCLLYTSRCV